ncbi:MAG TPA: hypothetical protein VFX30_14505 [bacterium]|nr:hypothetical protein [bacterium]
MKFPQALRFSALFLLFSLIGSSKALSADTGGFIQLYEKKELKGSAVTIKSGTDVPDMKKIATDDGKNGFDNKAASAKYHVPAGWQAVLYEDANFQKRISVYIGTGDTKDMDKFAGKCSSLRWESTGDQKPAAAPPAASPTTAPTK